MRTLRELAKEALDIQDACNPIGLSLGMGRALIDLKEVLDSLQQPSDTRAIRTHPVFQLWACKIHSLSLHQLNCEVTFGRAWDACKDLAQ